MTGVIILNFFSHDETIRLYKSLQAYPGLRSIVVDNSGDTVELSALKKAIPETELIVTGKNLGYAGGNNIGIRYFLKEPEIEAIALINPDVDIHNNIFPALLNVLECDHSVAATGPRLCIRNSEETIYSDGGVFHRGPYLKPGHLNSGNRVQEASADTSGRGTAVEEPTVASLPGQPPNSGGKPDDRQPDYINGSFLVMRVDAVRDIGLLDETFFLYFEEADWCMRACRAGWSLRVATEVTAYQAISPKEEIYNYHFFYSWLLFLHRHDPTGVRPLFVDQFKKVFWILRGSKGSQTKRIRLAYNRLMGILKGYFNR